MDKNSFLELIVPAAQENYKKYGVLPSVTIAQAALESGWGGSGLTKKANNLFGIKGLGTAGSIQMPTKEYENGKYIDILADFRAYNNFAESIDDHGKLLSSDRYKNVLSSPNYKSAAYAVKAAGYATSNTYAGDLIKVIEDNKLYQFDPNNTGVMKTGLLPPTIGLPPTNPYKPNPTMDDVKGALDTLNPLPFIKGVLIKAAFFVPAMILLAVGIYFLFSDQINTAVESYVSKGKNLISEGGN